MRDLGPGETIADTSSRRRGPARDAHTAVPDAALIAARRARGTPREPNPPIGKETTPAFVFRDAGYLLVLAALARVGEEGRPRRERPTTIRQDIAEGVAYALHTPEIRAVLGVLFVISHTTLQLRSSDGDGS
jgi:hypothetical protein